MAYSNLQLRQAAKYYPESDGLPMANNSEQFQLITTIKGNLDILLADNPQAYVAGDMFWYPIEGDNKTRTAPDVMVVFGRAKGKRGSHLQWIEADIASQVVFEILSPGNRRQEMDEKFEFYNRFGVEEYYLYDPERGRLQGWLRDEAGELAQIASMDNWRSPRLDIRFVLDGLALELYYPDGSRFLTFLEVSQRLDEAEKRALEALWDIDEAETRAREAEARAREAETRARQAELEKEQSEARVRELEARLKAAGIKE